MSLLPPVLRVFYLSGWLCPRRPKVDAFHDELVIFSDCFLGCLAGSKLNERASMGMSVPNGRIGFKGEGGVLLRDHHFDRFNFTEIIEMVAKIALSQTRVQVS